MKKIAILLTAGMLWFAPSCNVLEIEPISEILADNFYSGPSSAEAALMHAYNFFRAPLTQNYIVVPGIQSDEMFPTRGGNFTRNHTFQTQEIQGNVQDTWRELYGTVQSCNDILDNVPRIAGNVPNRSQVMGEAYFIRAYAFFYLTRFWGNVPLVTVPSKSANQDFNLPRTPVATVMQQVIDDLLQAEDLMSATHTNRGRAAKGTARALLAKAYLYRNGPGDVQAALSKTEEVMADAQYSLVSGANYASLFTVNAQNTSETIFEFSFRPNTSQANNALDEEFVPFPNNIPRVRPTQKIVDAFLAQPDDLRFAASLGFHNNAYYVKKYERNSVTEVARLTQANNVVMLRLADVVLMRAECLNELGRTQEAIPFLNQIRTRAGLDPTTAVTQEEVRQAIEDERFVELCFEGHRWWDSIRTNRATVLSAPRLTNPDRVLWPVPGRDIDLNPNLLPQNPSY